MQDGNQRQWEIFCMSGMVVYPNGWNSFPNGWNGFQITGIFIDSWNGFQMS